jgi:hypothetical protein
MLTNGVQRQSRLKYELIITFGTILKTLKDRGRVHAISRRPEPPGCDDAFRRLSQTFAVDIFTESVEKFLDQFFVGNEGENSPTH